LRGFEPATLCSTYIVIFAEVDEDLFKDEDRPGAAEDGERLSSEEAEDATGDAVALSSILPISFGRKKCRVRIYGQSFIQQ
jgi:hypothetical protein